MENRIRRSFTTQTRSCPSRAGPTAPRGGEAPRSGAKESDVSDKTQKNEGQKRRQLRKIIVHLKAHLDEFVACWLILRFGLKRWYWPENELPTVLFVADADEAARKYRGRTDTVLIGIGGGLFDEHRADGRLAGTCATDLVANALEISRRRTLQTILEETRKADTRSGQRPFELGTLLKVAQKRRRLTPALAAELFDFVCSRMDDYLDEAKEEWERCPAVFEQAGRIETVRGITVASVQSDLTAMPRWLRNERGAAIVIQRNSKGQIVIFSQKGSAATAFMAPIAREVLIQKTTRSGAGVDELARRLEAFEEIVKSGRGRDLPGLSTWYFHIEAGSLLNGSETHPHVTPTKITLDEMAVLVKTVIESMAAIKLPETVAVAEAPAAPDLTSAVLAAAEANGGE